MKNFKKTMDLIVKELKVAVDNADKSPIDKTFIGKYGRLFGNLLITGLKGLPVDPMPEKHVGGRFVIGYHWTDEPRLDMGKLTEGSFYISPEAHGWAPLHCKNQYLYRVIAWVENPKISFNLEPTYEINLARDWPVDTLISRGHDAHYFKPSEHPSGGYEADQILLVNGKKMIVSCEKLISINDKSVEMHTALHRTFTLETYKGNEVFRKKRYEIARRKTVNKKKLILLLGE